MASGSPISPESSLVTRSCPKDPVPPVTTICFPWRGLCEDVVKVKTSNSHMGFDQPPVRTPFPPMEELPIQCPL